MNCLEKYFSFVKKNWISYASKHPDLSVPDLQELLLKSWTETNSSNLAKSKAKAFPYFSDLVNPYLDKNTEKLDTDPVNSPADKKEDSELVSKSVLNNNKTLTSPRESKLKVKFKPPRKIMCEETNCIFCNSKSCNNCSKCKVKKKCLRRICPRLEMSSSVGHNVPDMKTLAECDNVNQFQLLEELTVSSTQDYTATSNAVNHSLESVIEEEESYQGPDVGNICDGSAEQAVAVVDEQRSMIHESGIRPDVDKICDGSTEQAVAVVDEQRSMPHESDTSCSKCGKIYKQLQSLKKHRCQNRFEKVKCPSCNKYFSKTNMSKHIKLHSRTIFKCNFCSRHFLTEDTKDRHLSVHKSKKCTTCGKKFSRPASLADHLKLHSGEVNVISESQSKYARACKICKKNVTSRRELTEHLEKEHIDLCIPCDVCKKVYFSKTAQRNHMKYHEIDGNSDNGLSDEEDTVDLGLGVAENTINSETVDHIVGKEAQEVVISVIDVTEEIVGVERTIWEDMNSIDGGSDKGNESRTINPWNSFGVIIGSNNI